MLVPDISFNPSASFRNDSWGEMADISTLKYPGGRPPVMLRSTQLAVKEVLITQTKMLEKPTEIFLVTVVTDNRSTEPIKLRIASYKHIQPNQFLPLAPCGLLAYSHAADTRPSFLDYRILIIEAREGLHEVRKLWNKIMTAPKCISVRDILVNVARVAPPSSSLIGVASDIVLNLAARTINESEHAQLLYVRGTFDKKVDEMGMRYGLISQGNEYASVKYQVEKI
ncbi:MAG: hypothetical protein V4714_11470 [Bacteroidota bacterium]